MMQPGIDEIARAPSFWSALLQIVFINILLSGDNALVIAMACRALPRRQRIWGMAIGAGADAVLLIAFAAIMSRLLELPYLKIAGGLALIYIAAKLLIGDDADEVEAASHLWRAVRMIVVADLVMSFDNILAVVEIARGNLALLAIGLAVSIPIVLAGATLMMALLRRLPILVWAGAGLLGWVAGQTIVSDQAIARTVISAAGQYRGGIELAAGCGGVVLVLAAGGLWRYWRGYATNPQ
jgi:YjbE family integral membrane protein